MNEDQRFQVMPELREEEYQKLKESIAEQGVLIPIEKDGDTGEILDGFHRMRACEELGIEPPVMERRFESDTERKIHAFTLNLARRQLGPVSWGKAFGNLLEARGVKTGSENARQNTADTVSAVAGEAGVNERTARRRMNLARDLEGHPEVAKQVDRGEITPMEGRRRVGAVSTEDPEDPEAAEAVRRGETSLPKAMKPHRKPKSETGTPPKTKPTVRDTIEGESVNDLNLPPFDLPEERKVYRKIIVNLKDLSKLDNGCIVSYCKGPEEADRAVEHLDALIEDLGDLRKRFADKKREWSKLRAVN